MSQRIAARRPGRVVIGLLATMLAALSGVTVPAAVALPDGSSGKIEPAAASALAAKGSADFWVLFRDTADLSKPSAIKDWAARGAAVVDALRHTANTSQAPVRTELDARQVSYESFYVANAILVNDGSTALAESLADRQDVAGILAPRDYELPEPMPGTAEAEINAVEWSLAAINADDVWNTFGVRGAGITVASIDSGVQFDHPALVGKYRGNTGGGTFNHNYNWFDPTNRCGNPSLAPCDTDGHGTHTMGTMVGDDGAGNQIGVAPQARWITAAGCCSRDGLLRSGQWILAPTDLAGANPRPDLRPHIVNNSWGSSDGLFPTDPFYQATVSAWRAAGIFPAFSNGNSGQWGCDTSGSPGDYADTSYSSGAFDSSGAIAAFSARGPGENGSIKPNLSAPGVNVRSSHRGGLYRALSGTSMASPHTAGTVALMWSAKPSLVGNVSAAEQLLDATATDVSDLTCGGTAADNNVWGEGKLNAFAVVEQVRRGIGTLTGSVTNANTGSPVAGAGVHIAGPLPRDVVTGADGRFSAALSAGNYTVTASAFGFVTSNRQATVTDGQTTTLNFPMTPQPSGTVSGVVRDALGAAVPNVTVQVLGTPIAAVRTGANGSYSIPNVPFGSYQVKASAGGCYDPHTQALTVDGNETLNFVTPSRKDMFGYSCVLEASNYVEGDTPVALAGEDEVTTIPLPFDFPFYGKVYREGHVDTNGNVHFAIAVSALRNVAIPDRLGPNGAIYPMWDDLVVDSSSRVMTKLSGTAPNRKFLIEWRNVMFWNTTLRVDFEAVLAENGEISMHYRNLDPGQARELGSSVTVGIESHTGMDALQYSFNTPILSNALSIRFKR